METFVGEGTPQHRARLVRLEVLAKFIQEKKEVARLDLSRFWVKDPRCQLSLRVLSDYLYSLTVWELIDGYDPIRWVGKSASMKELLASHRKK